MTTIDDTLVQAAGEQIRQIIADGIMLREVLDVIRETILRPKHLWIMYTDHEWVVLHRENTTALSKGKLFTHTSLVSALEFALKWTPDESR